MTADGGMPYLCGSKYSGARPCYLLSYQTRSKNKAMMAQHFSLLLLLLMHLSHGQEDTASQDAAVSKKGANNIRHLHSSGMHRQYYCGLQNAPIMKVAKNETSGTLYKIDENTTTATDQVYAVKQCACYSWLINETNYCPMDSAYCSISVAYDYHYSHYTARIEDHETTVRCYRDTQLKSFARYVFKYSTIIMSALIIVLIFTDTGHNITRYTLSRCIPRINRRHVEERLNREIEQQRQHFFRWRERMNEEGYLFGLKLKTKIYRREVVRDSHSIAGVGNGDDGYDENMIMCSICILELEDGERIADLNCNHCFHADCLSEWIKKKNSCPLCQEEGIAEEVRSYDIETEAPHADTIENVDAYNRRSFEDGDVPA